jgi:hypothetical protein
MGMVYYHRGVYTGRHNLGKEITMKHLILTMAAMAFAYFMGYSAAFLEPVPSLRTQIEEAVREKQCLLWSLRTAGGEEEIKDTIVADCANLNTSTPLTN